MQNEQSQNEQSPTEGAARSVNWDELSKRRSQAGRGIRPGLNLAPWTEKRVNERIN